MQVLQTQRNFLNSSADGKRSEIIIPLRLYDPNPSQKYWFVFRDVKVLWKQGYKFKYGYDIVCLVLTFLYHYYPELIKAGKVYWGVTPLFKVESKGKKYFAYNEKELKTLPKGDVTRLKGLGESQPEDFRATIFSSDARMVQIKMNDAAQAKYYFDILLGEDIKSRKEYIFEHADFDNLED